MSLRDDIERVQATMPPPTWTISLPSPPSRRDRVTCGTLGHEWWFVISVNVCARCGVVGRNPTRNEET